MCYLKDAEHDAQVIYSKQQLWCLKDAEHHAQVTHSKNNVGTCPTHATLFGYAASAINTVWGDLTKEGEEEKSMEQRKEKRGGREGTKEGRTYSGLM